MLPLLPAVLLALPLGCRPALPVGKPSPPVTHAPPAQLWVDAKAPEGDGSRAAPLRSLTQALARAQGPTTIHLAQGMYPGPFQLGPGVSLVGQGAVVLHAKDEAVAVALSPGSSLQGLYVQGGRVGISSRGPARLVEVRLSGQREVAVRHEGGALEVSGGTWEAGVSDTVGLLVTGGQVEARGVRFTGPFRRGLQLEAGSHARATDLTFVGPVTAVQCLGCEATLTRVSASEGRGVAVFASGGRLRASGLTVQGHEYALMVRDGTRLEVEGLRSTRAERAGLAVVKGSAVLEGVWIEHCGNHGGMQLVSADVEAREVTIRDAQAYGISAIDSRLRLERATIAQVADLGGGAGDGLHLRRTRAQVGSLQVQDTAGAGVLAAEHSKLVLRDAQFDRAGWGGVLAESGAKVWAEALTIRGSAAAGIAVPGEAQVRVTGLRAEQNAQGAVWAECAAGAQVFIFGLTPAMARSPCVRDWPRPVLPDPLGE
jgi:hypothetical protein